MQNKTGFFPLALPRRSLEKQQWRRGSNRHGGGVLEVRLLTQAAMVLGQAPAFTEEEGGWSAYKVRLEAYF